MLWYKSWLETRWRFAIGLVILICSAAAIVFTYPAVLKRLPLASSVDLTKIDPGGAIGNGIREELALVREYRGYVWSQWFRENLPQTWTIFAVLLGTGGLLSQTAGGAALYTLSMPVSRTRLLGIRAATGLAEILVLAVVPALMIPLLSPAIGQTFSFWDAWIYGICLFVGGGVFFSLAFLLSTVFTDVWRPALIAIGVAVAFGIGGQIHPGLGTSGVIPVMTGQSYFRTGELPWVSLLAGAAAAAAMLYAATVSIARRDF